MPKLNREQRAIFLLDDVIRTVQAMEAVSGASGQREVYFTRGRLSLASMGSGTQRIIISDERLKARLTAKWWVAVEHCRLCVGTAQYWLNGRHQYAK
jgi:hypothetical protein